MERNNKRYERYKMIYDTFEPFRQAKKKTIHSIMSYGKKHPILKYPVLLGAVAFIFAYNVFLHLLIQMHVREKLARGLAFSMVVVLVITSVDVRAFAMTKAEEKDESVLVVELSALPENIRIQQLGVGASEDEIEFPDKLNVTTRKDIEETTEETIEETTEEISAQSDTIRDLSDGIQGEVNTI